LLLAILGFIAVVLTLAMFISKNIMLGFPCALFWAIFGGQAYLSSTTPWGDIYYYLFFASTFGMTSFSALAAYGLRERKDSLADDEMDEWADEVDDRFIDEGPDEEDSFSMDDEGPRKKSLKTQKRQERVVRRRESAARKR
jgi:hypothetical protein